MANLSYEQKRLHKRACALVDSDQPLSVEDREFILNHYQPSLADPAPWARAHFTPASLAREIVHAEVRGSRVIDLCAGIGHLASHVRDPGVAASGGRLELVCVERNPDFVKVGRRVVPDAWWICADVMAIPQHLGRLGTFDFAISNPPYGAIPRDGHAPGGYVGRRFEYHVIAIAALIARRGAFLVPRLVDPFRYCSQEELGDDGGDDEYRKFVAETGIELRTNTAIDTSCYERHWPEVTPRVDVVRAEFTAAATSAAKTDRREPLALGR